MHPPPSPPLSARGVEPPTKFSKIGGLTGPQLLGGGGGGGGGSNFHINKLKSEMFNDKKSL